MCGVRSILQQIEDDASLLTTLQPKDKESKDGVGRREEREQCYALDEFRDDLRERAGEQGHRVVAGAQPEQWVTS